MPANDSRVAAIENEIAQVSSRQPRQVEVLAGGAELRRLRWQFAMLAQPRP